MKRDKALGNDPLAWIKATKEAEAKQAGEVPKSEEQEASSSEATHPKIKKPKDVGVVGAEDTKGRPLIEKPQPVQKTIEVKQGRIHTIPEQGYMGTKEGVVEGRVKTPYGTTRMIDSTIPLKKERSQSSIFFIIAYAFILLILVFFVYFNLSKRMDNISLRISNIEQALNIGFKEKAPMLR
jgi:hypothetical protein